MLHQSKAHYWQTSISAWRTQFTANDSKLLADLTRLGMELQQNPDFEPAPVLLDMLNGHSFFKDVDRVCIVEVIGAGNHLRVLSSAVSDHVPQNLMKRGYSCFVAPEGSLLQLKEGELRIFGHTEDVLKSYEDEKKPAQRSINWVHRMGLQSGLCLGQRDGRGMPLGYFFLNSCKPDAFNDLQREHTAILSILNLFIKLILLDHHHRFSGEDPLLRTGLSAVGSIFDEEHFRIQLAHILDSAYQVTPQIKIVSTIKEPFLFAEQDVAQGLAFLAAQEHHAAPDTPLVVFINQADKCLNFSLLRNISPGTDLSLDRRLNAMIQSSFKTSYTFELTLDNYQFTIPFDPASSHEEVVYSI